MIDLETLDDITKINNNIDKKSFFSRAFTYFAFPSILVLSHKDKLNVITEKLFGSIEQNNTLKQYNYKKSEDKREIDNIISNIEYKIDIFAILQNLSLLMKDENNKEKLTNYSKMLITQSFFGMNFKNVRSYYEELENTEKYKEILEIMGNYNKLFRGSQDVKNFLKKYRFIYGDIIDFYKRIDIYSFGIMLLQSLDIAINKKIITTQQEQMIVELTEIIYRCCIQKENCENINDIVVDFEKIVGKFVENQSNGSPDKKRRKGVSVNKTPTINDVKKTLVFPEFTP